MKRLWRWLRGPRVIEVNPDSPGMVAATVLAGLAPESYPRSPVVEALARQRALAEQRLRRPTEDRQLEQGRRMACIEVAKELGIHDDVTSRTYELRKRR